VTEFLANTTTANFMRDVFCRTGPGPGLLRASATTVFNRAEQEGEFDRKRDLAGAHSLCAKGSPSTVLLNDAQGAERFFAFRSIPRIISPEEWKKIRARGTGTANSLHSPLFFCTTSYHGQSFCGEWRVFRKITSCSGSHFRPGLQATAQGAAEISTSHICGFPISGARSDVISG